MSGQDSTVPYPKQTVDYNVGCMTIKEHGSNPIHNSNNNDSSRLRHTEPEPEPGPESEQSQKADRRQTDKHERRGRKLEQNRTEQETRLNAKRERNSSIGSCRRTEDRESSKQAVQFNSIHPNEENPMIDKRAIQPTQPFSHSVHFACGIISKRLKPSRRGCELPVERRRAPDTRAYRCCCPRDTGNRATDFTGVRAAATARGRVVGGVGVVARFELDEFPALLVDDRE